jgi:CDP-diacylglycerol--serine O-phosphatidyltransferase
MKKHIPNLLTLANLACGVLAILQCFEGSLTSAFYLMLMALAFDFFDGFVARALKVSGELGKQLDSLADCVSFGVVPSIVMYRLISYIPTPFAEFKYCAVLIALFSAFRLAKFNIDTRQADTFIGLPTPANALFICSLPLIVSQNNALSTAVNNAYVFLSITILMSFLLVSELPLIALKFKSFNPKINLFKYLLISMSLLYIFLFRQLAAPFIIITYVGLSIINTIIDYDKLVKPKS